MVVDPSLPVPDGTAQPDPVSGAQVVLVTLPDDAPARLDTALARAVPADLALSRSRLQALIADGAVRRGNRVLSSPKARVAPGEVIILTVPPARPAGITAQAIPLVVVFEDADLIVVDKPAGMVTHPAPGAPDGTLVNALMAHCGDSLSGIGGAERPGIVHRLDRDTSGLLVVAKTDRAHQGLSAQFAAHTVDRAYRALCWGAPDPSEPKLTGRRGTSFEPGGVLKVTAPLARHKADRKRQAVRWDAEARHAVTRFTTQARFGPADKPRASLLTCRLETGRTHQIRVHAAHIGHPLLADPVYGNDGARQIPPGVAAALAGMPGQALHAGVLGFIHPVTGENCRFEAAPPVAFNTLLTSLEQI